MQMFLGWRRPNIRLEWFWIFVEVKNLQNKILFTQTNPYLLILIDT